MRNWSWLTTAGALLTLSPAASAQTLVVYAFDQAQDRLLRIADFTGDGDTTDPGEVTVFMTDASAQLGLENCLGLFALGAWRVLATDNFVPRNVLLLTDLNRDGDALDSDEAREWWNGALPGGGGLALPAGLSMGPPVPGSDIPAVYLIDNNALDLAVPEAIYRLHDANNNQAISPDEVTIHATLSPAGGSATNAFDVEFDPAGRGYVLDAVSPPRILVIDPAGGVGEWLTAADALSLTGQWRLDTSLPDMAFLTASDELVVPMLRGASSLTAFLAFRDRDESGRIDAADEWRVLWDEGLQAEANSCGPPRDVYALRDGSLIWADMQADRIWRLRDVNGDGDYLDQFETTVLYDSIAASAAGLPGATQLLSLTGEFACSGDSDDDGDSDLDDLLGVLAGFGISSGARPADGDLNGDGAVDLDDMLIILAAFGASCR